MQGHVAHMRLVCAGDVFVHVCSLGIASAVEALRVIEVSHLKQNISSTCVRLLA